MNPAVTATSEKATPPAPRIAGDLLGPFGVLVVAMLLAALTLATLLLMTILHRRMHERVVSGSPALMNVLADAVREPLRARSTEQLMRVAGDMTRIPQVHHCRITPATRDDQQVQSIVAAQPDQTDAALIHLKAPVRDTDGALLGELEVAYGPGEIPGMAAVFWTASGSVAVAALGFFAVLYRGFCRRVRPITHVRDNLLAYHTGQERSLDLLAVQDGQAQIASAWNELIGFVRNLQSEVDELRSREAIAGSAHLFQSQGSREVLDALPVGVLRIDADRRLDYCNTAAAQLLQLSCATPGLALAEAGLAAPVLESLRSLRAAALGASCDVRIDCGGGGYSMLRLTRVAANTGDDGQTIMIQDVSQIHEAERTREEFLDHITHELRTPLTNIRAYTETLGEDFFDDAQTRRECYNVIMGETRRLSKLIEDVLSASQIEAGAARLEKSPVRIDQSLRQAVQETQAAATAKQLDLALKIPTKVPLVIGDRHRLHQVWTNLIGNAIKYTPPGGSVTVDVSTEGNVLRVRVSDSGIGIAPEAHERIFEKFYRVTDPAVQAEEGTGLGLAIARDIVRIHGGTIRVESAVGRGSTFSVELPVARAASLEERGEPTDGVHHHR